MSTVEFGSIPGLAVCGMTLCLDAGDWMQPQALHASPVPKARNQRDAALRSIARLGHFLDLMGLMTL